MKRYTEKQLVNALACEKFLRIRSGHYVVSLNVAARACGKPASFFSGANSMLARYLRDGIETFKP